MVAFSTVVVALSAAALQANALPLTKRVAQVISDSTTKWEAACNTAGGGSQCNVISVNAFSTLLAAPGPCEQQNAADTMINLAKQLNNNAQMISLAQIFAQQPRNSLPSCPVLPVAPNNTELTGLYQCQFQSVNEKTFVGGLAAGSAGTIPFGLSAAVSPAGSCPANPSGPIPDGQQLVDITQNPGVGNAGSSGSSGAGNATGSSAAAAPTDSAVGSPSSASDVGSAPSALPMDHASPMWISTDGLCCLGNTDGFGCWISTDGLWCWIIPTDSTGGSVPSDSAVGSVPSASSIASAPSDSAVGSSPTDSAAGSVPSDSAPAASATASSSSCSDDPSAPDAPGSASPVASGSASSGSGSGFQLQNGLDAQKLNAQFATLSATSTCNAGDQACINGGFAQCVGGKYVVEGCSASTTCLALPLVNKAGTSLSCTTQSDAAARIAAAGATGGVTGSN
ncbi:hypothetical protein B0H21DRAFT_884815 [Amylocystis lapponica]|nr:hypothetical protein B0H21DRAFT_884815 [Amylocystis lapponica]